MQYDEEKLEYKLKSLQIQENALLEERSSILYDIEEAKRNKENTKTLQEQLRENTSNLKEIKKQIRQAYKDYRNVN